MNLRETLVEGLQSLPGEDAHEAMAPGGRMRSSEALQNAQVVKESGVSIHVFEKNKEARILLTQRTNYKGTHGGQVAFPGGKLEELDKSIEDCARRESWEETGIPKEAGETLGQLTEIYIPVSQFRVRPFVIFHDEFNFELVPEQREVAEIFSIPFRFLLDENSVEKVNIPLSPQFTLKDVPCFKYEDKIIWGATAIILNEFKVMLKNLEF
jgi:8-oxo-dGTP pyrophosphatase MutT (NUDIX family)